MRPDVQEHQIKAAMKLLQELKATKPGYLIRRQFQEQSGMSAYEAEECLLQAEVRLRQQRRSTK